MSSDNPDSEKKSPDVADMLLEQRGEKVIDSETMIMETQKRVWGALKKGYEYTGITNESEKFFRENVFKKINIVVLYVDLVGSTSAFRTLAGARWKNRLPATAKKKQQPTRGQWKS